MSGAGQALVEAAFAALRTVADLNGVYDGLPLAAAFPYAVIEAGPETDWSHKSGEGRELRLSILIRDKGERPDRLRSIVPAAEVAAAGLGPDLKGWRLVNLAFLRGSMLRGTGAAWTAAIEYRARLLKT